MLARRRLRALGAALVLVGLAPALERPARGEPATDPPEPAAEATVLADAAPQAELGTVLDVVLPCGLRVLAARDISLPVAAVILAVETGSEDDPPESPGLVHALAYHLHQGNRELRPGEAIAAAQDAGGVHTLATGPAQVRFESLVPISRLDEVLFVESQRLRHPTLDRRRWKISLGWAGSDARGRPGLSPRDLAELHGASGLAHGGRMVDRSLAEIAPASLAAALASRFHYGRATLIVVAPEPPAAIVEQVAAKFSDLPAAARSVPTRPAPPPRAPLPGASPPTPDAPPAAPGTPTPDAPAAPGARSAAPGADAGAMSPVPAAAGARSAARGADSGAMSPAPAAAGARSAAPGADPGAMSPAASLVFGATLPSAAELPVLASLGAGAPAGTGKPAASGTSPGPGDGAGAPSPAAGGGPSGAGAPSPAAGGGPSEPGATVPAVGGGDRSPVPARPAILAWPVPADAAAAAWAGVLCRGLNRQKRGPDEPRKARIACVYHPDPRRALLVIRPLGTDDPIGLTRARLARLGAGDLPLLNAQARFVAQMLRLHVRTPLGLARQLATSAPSPRAPAPSSVPFARRRDELTGLASLGGRPALTLTVEDALLIGPPERKKK